MAPESTAPLALVTGASSGIGRELAIQFGQHGFALIIAAEDEALTEAEQALREAGFDVRAVRVDLATYDGVEELWRETTQDGRPLAAAALNAGIGAGGRFTETSLDQELEIVDLNVRSTVHLAKHVVRLMTQQGEGRILFTSSIASTMPGPYQAVYNASKSFVQSLAVGLRAELAGTGVSVTSLMPGPTDTRFFDRAGMRDTKVGADPDDDPVDVARDGFAALMDGDERVVSHSVKTKIQGRTSRLMPDRVKAAMHALMAKPGSA